MDPLWDWATELSLYQPFSFNCSQISNHYRWLDGSFEMRIDGDFEMRKPADFGMPKDGRMVMPIGDGINANMQNSRSQI